MLKTIIAASLIVVSLLPNSQFKASLESNLQNALVKPSATIEDPTENTETPTITKSGDFKSITLGSRAALFVDKKTGEVLYEKNSDHELPMASITKLMTAIVAISEIEPGAVLTVPTLNTKPLDSRMGLAAGDKVKFSEILHGLLINSGSDAALTISDHVSGGEPEFAALMNEKAQLLGLSETEFTNSVGWDAKNHKSTARDLVNLTSIALSNTQIENVVKKKSYIAKSENGRKYVLSNTNLLLNSSTYLGAKTGTTFAAGECLATYFNDGEREIIGVVLNSPNRFGETQNMVNWIKENYVFYGTE